MAMRRIWIVVGSVPMADGTVTVQIDENNGCRQPAVYDNFLTAQDYCDETNADMRAAVERGDLQSFDHVRPHPAWYLDESRVISTFVENTGFDVLDIPDLQLYCRQQGLL